MRLWIEAILPASLPQRGLIQLQMLIGTGGLAAIQDVGVLRFILLISIVHTAVCTAEDHGSKSAVANGQRMIPYCRGLPIPQHVCGFMGGCRLRHA